MEKKNRWKWEKKWKSFKKLSVQRKLLENFQLSSLIYLEKKKISLILDKIWLIVQPFGNKFLINFDRSDKIQWDLHNLTLNFSSSLSPSHLSLFSLTLLEWNLDLWQNYSNFIWNWQQIGFKMNSKSGSNEIN